MGILEAMERRASPEDPRTSLSSFPEWWVDAFGGAETDAGIPIGPMTAANISTVYAAVRVHCDSLGALPFKVFETSDDGTKVVARDHELYALLHDEPNPLMTSLVFREVLTAHVHLWGNGYAEIERDNADRPVAFWPISPDRVEVLRAGMRLIYRVTLKNGGMAFLDAADVLHVPNWGYDGLIGTSTIGQERRNVLGLAAALQKHGAKFFGNGARPGGVIRHPGQLSPEAAERLRQQWQKLHGGLDNANRVAILEEGMEWAQQSIPPEDAQFLQSRQFQRTEIAALFRVPLHMLGDLERATFSNIEHQSIEFVRDTLRPWLVRWEQEVNRKLFRGTPYRSEFVVDGLLRGDTQQRYEGYAIGRQNGFLSVNDIRRLENLNPIEGGDVYLNPLNMTPARGGVGLALDERTITLNLAAPAPSSTSWGRTNAQPVATESRSLGGRIAARDAQVPLFRDIAERVLSKEAKAALTALRKAERQRSLDDLRVWLEEFYADDNGFHEFVARAWLPALLAYAAIVQAEAAREVGFQVGVSPGLEAFVSGYARTAARRHVSISRGDLYGVIDDRPPEELVAALEERLASWQTVRPGTIAFHEAAEAGGAFAKEAYREGGVTRLRWVASGSETCPLCSELHGRIVGIEGHFVDKDEEHIADGAAPIRPPARITHPPLHRGCDCMIVAA